MFQTLVVHNQSIILQLLMELDKKESVGPSAPAEVFGLQFLNSHLNTLTIRVAEVQKDFLEHYSYKIEFLLDGNVMYEVCRRYTEFAAFYEMLHIKFTNIKLQSFPSKWQLFKKITHRMEYFNSMMNTLINYAQNHPEVRLKILTCIASFVCPELQTGPRKKSGSIGSSPAEADKLAQQKLTKSDIQPWSQKDPWSQKQQWPPKETEVSKQIKEVQEPKEPKEMAKKTSKQNWAKVEPRRSLKIPDAGYQYFDIRFQGQFEWKKRYLKINGSTLDIYKDISKNTWQNKIELYRAKIEYLRKEPNLMDHFMQKMEFQLEMPHYPEDYQYVSIFHEYDYKKIIITTPEATSQKTTEALASLLQKLTVASCHNTIREDYEGYFGVVGKIYFIIYNITFTSELQQKEKKSFWLVRLKTSGFSYDTKQVQMSDTRIKQGFIIPVPDAFEKFTIELVKITIEGVITEDIKQTVVASATILMNDLLSYTNDSKFQKVFLKLYPEQGPRANDLAQVQITIRNLSDLSSIYSDSYANANDGRIITYEKMSNREIVRELGNTIDRLLYVVAAICMFLQNTWRNIYFFKYPRLASVVFTFLAIAFLVSDMNNLITFLIICLCLAVVYNHRYVYSIVNELSDRFLTGKSHLHPDFKNPLVLGKSEFKYLNWSNNLEQIKEEMNQEDNKKEQMKKQTGFFLLRKGDNEYKIEQEKRNLYEKFAEVKQIIQEIHDIINTVVAFFQKIGSLYSWADFRRTLYFLIFVLFVVCFANAVALRLLGFLFCLHRFKKGYQFYRKHYARNKKLASSVLTYIIHKNFRELLANLPNDRVVPVEELVCPIEPDFLKKMKKQIEALIPIKMNISDIVAVLKRQQTQSLQKPAETTNPQIKFIEPYIINKKLKIAYFIDLIETCESRLKLEKLITAEGRSEGYQKLRQQTKEDPAIDIWLEDLIRNYMGNIPSQLYTVIHREDRSENNIFGKDVYEEPVDFENKIILSEMLESHVQHGWPSKMDSSKKTN